MSQIFEQYALKKINVDWIHASPWIPSRQLQNALRVYAKIARIEKPLVLLDTSPQGNGESGLLLTDAFLHIHCEGRRMSAIPVKHMRSLLFVPEYGGASHLFVDGRRVLRQAISFVDQIELKRFLTMLESYARSLGAINVYYRVTPIVGRPEENDLDDLETKQAIRTLQND